MTAKNPKFLKPMEGLNDTQRKSLGLPRTPPRERHPDEATSVVICAASAPRGYVPGEGESRHVSVRYVTGVSA